MTPIKYHEAAEVELLNEIGYLELQAKGLGRRFYTEVCRAERLIAQLPESAAEIRPDILKRYSGNSGTRSFIRERRIVYSSWLRLTIAVGRSIGLVVPGEMTRNRRAVRNKAMETMPRSPVSVDIRQHWLRSQYYACLI